jgi:hypothetical protein
MSFSRPDLERLAADKWYYEIELADGIVTNGCPRPNAAVYRDFFERIDFKDKVCLDIGTQEFVSPVLMKRHGAGHVVAYDRLALTERYKAICQSYDVNFDYIHGLSLNDLKVRLKSEGKPTAYDIVNFSGVLYHMIDPLAGMAMARSFLRKNGLMILETSVKKSGDSILEFNDKGRIYPGSNYFQISIGTIDYWIRMLRMEALDCTWWGGADVCRFLVICRATDGVAPDTDDQWMEKRFITVDLEPYGLNFGELESNAPPVSYEVRQDAEFKYRSGTKRIDLFKTVKANPRYNHKEARTTLCLDDMA